MNRKRNKLKRPALILRPLPFILLLIFLPLLDARAMSLEDYRERVAAADGAMSRLLELYEAAKDDEQRAAARFKNEEAQALRELRAALPVTEKVSWPGGTLDVNNRWLQDELDAYDKLPPAPTPARLAALTRIDERIHALYERLDEAANAAHTEQRDKTAEKGRLHAILQRPEYNEEAAHGSALERLWQRFLRWLRSLLPQARPMQPGSAMALSRVARAVIYTLSIVLIIFVLRRYGPRLLRRKLTREHPRRARVVLGEQLAPDQTPADLLSEAERLARSGDLRGAMRKAYIAVLCELGERKLLRLAPHKTNRDYLRHLRDHAQIFNAVQPLTNAYERHWYGLTPASDADWSEFRTRANEVTSDSKV